MKHLPHQGTLIQLSQGDIRTAIEYWLNSRILKAPCSVSEVKELSTMEGGRFEIVFDRRPLSKEDTTEISDAGE